MSSTAVHTEKWSGNVNAFYVDHILLRPDKNRCGRQKKHRHRTFLQKPPAMCKELSNCSEKDARNVK
jgi:hypothetical protein